MFLGADTSASAYTVSNSAAMIANGPATTVESLMLCTTRTRSLPESRVKARICATESSGVMSPLRSAGERFRAAIQFR